MIRHEAAAVNRLIDLGPQNAVTQSCGCASAGSLADAGEEVWPAHALAVGVRETGGALKSRAATIISVFGARHHQQWRCCDQTMAKQDRKSLKLYSPQKRKLIPDVAIWVFLFDIDY
jgi:hypothetical protein